MPVPVDRSDGVPQRPGAPSRRRVPPPRTTPVSAAGSAARPAPRDRPGPSLELLAVRTGAGTAVLGAVAAIFVVGACWLPTAHASGGARTVLAAGVLVFLAALHGGITVGGLPFAFVPLGLPLAVGWGAWRAGRSLADAVDAAGERRRVRLVRLAVVQVVSFVVPCSLAARTAVLHASRAPVLGVTMAAALLFAVSGTVSFVRAGPLRDAVVGGVPGWLATSVRAAAAVLAVQLAAGAVLVGAALLVHHERVEQLSRGVGGGWSGLPVLALSVLTAPNAAVAGAAYLGGPGFALGSGTHVSLFTAAHGTLPALPLLGAVPNGRGGTPLIWILAGVAAVSVGYATARTIRPASAGWTSVTARLGGTAAVAAVGACVLGWQAGGAVGSGRLAAVGPSPWQVALATGAEVAVTGGAALGVFVLMAAVRGRSTAERPAAAPTAGVRPAATRPVAVAPAPSSPDDGDPVEPADSTDAPGTDRLAG